MSALFKLYINSVPGVIELFLKFAGSASIPKFLNASFNYLQALADKKRRDLYIIYYLQLKPLLIHFSPRSNTINCYK